MPEDALPARYVAYGHCFRHEAGGKGHAHRGLYRLHQFSKVELFAYTTPDNSEAMLEEMLELQKQIIGGLGLHARVLEMPTHELGAAAYRKVSNRIG